MSQDTIDFWFSVGSTYPYLAVSRLEKVAADDALTWLRHGSLKP